MWVGMSYPAKASEKGLFENATDEKLIKCNIIQIIGTRRGERVRLPLFGTRLWEYIHDPLDQAVEHFLRADLIEAIQRWEPRAILVRIKFSQDKENQILNVKIVYATEQKPDDSEFDIALDAKTGGVTWI